jgi:hypothetical protein
VYAEDDYLARSPSRERDGTHSDPRTRAARSRSGENFHSRPHARGLGSPFDRLVNRPSASLETRL